MMEFMRSHYEDTVLEQRYDVGAGPFHLPYRFRPRSYSATSKDGKLLNYTHERGVGQFQTAWAHVAQCRNTTEHPLGGVYWWGTDDATMAQYVPWYPSITAVPGCVSRVDPHEVHGNLHFRLDSLWWVSNLVSNWVYFNYKNTYPTIQEKHTDFHAYFLDALQDADEEIARLNASSPDGRKLAVEYATAMNRHWAEKVRYEWLELFIELFVRYNDIVQRDVVEAHRDPTVTVLEYDQAWLKRVAELTGDFYKIAPTPTDTTAGMERLRNAPWF
jgi:dipeptidase